MNTNFRMPAIAIIYGTIAGAIAALTFVAMNQLQALIWHHPLANTAVGIFVIIMIGGALLALLCHHQQLRLTSLDAQFAYTTQEHGRKQLAFLSLSAIVAVAFGGAIGPEAGLLAVVAQCSSLVGLRLKQARERQLLRQTGAMAALSGLYGAPPAVALDEISASDKTADKSPLIIRLLACVFGLLGFWLTYQALSDGSFHRLSTPLHTPQAMDLLYALIPIAAASILGWLFLSAHYYLPKLLNKIHRSIGVQILIASAIFASIAAYVPLVRFSGHHELEYALQFSEYLPDAPQLIIIAVAKMLAMAVCLSGHWRGGEFFPAVFAGFALALAVHLLLPVIPLSVAIAGSVGALVVVCMGKPIAALLILLLLIDIQAPSALFLGVLAGTVVRHYLPVYSSTKSA